MMPWYAGFDPAVWKVNEWWIGVMVAVGVRL